MGLTCGNTLPKTMICSFLYVSISTKNSCVKHEKTRTCTFLERKSDVCRLVCRPCCTPLTLVACESKTARGHANLSRGEFDQLWKENQLRICLIGMSNCGKTMRSLQLAQRFGFERYCVDDNIEQHISSLLQRSGYPSGIEGVAKWMGYPFEERFYRNQEIYLEYENKLTYEAVSTAQATNRSFVLDTTGSVIYLEKKTRDIISDTFLVVHLEASEDMLQEMIRLYFEAPKPVIWGDSFQPLGNEDGLTALKRCYPQLLRYRLKRYQQFAHCSVPASVAMNSAVPVEIFVERLRACLPPQAAH